MAEKYQFTCEQNDKELANRKAEKATEWTSRKVITSSFWTASMLGMAILVPLALAPPTLQAEDQKNTRTYHDKGHNDDHQWDSHENQAYGVWAKQNHRKSRDFSKLKDNDQQAYWSWRHEHSDALLKIDIR